MKEQVFEQVFESSQKIIKRLTRGNLPSVFKITAIRTVRYLYLIRQRNL